MSARIMRRALLSALLALPVLLHAQSIYRCGDKYQDRPCDAGQKGRVVGTTKADPASAAWSPATIDEHTRERLRREDPDWEARMRREAAQQEEEARSRKAQEFRWREIEEAERRAQEERRADPADTADARDDDRPDFRDDPKDRPSYWPAREPRTRTGSERPGRDK